MTNNQLTDERLSWLHDAATELSNTNLKMTMKPEELLLLTTELQARRKAAAEPSAYLVCNGRLYQDRPFLSLSAARISVNDRNDGAEIKALCVDGTLAEKAK